MERYYVGLDVSKEKTAICVRRSDGSMDKACETRTDPDAIFAALAPFRDGLERVILETGRMANWLYDELTRRGLPAVCVDARQAHAVLGQMHNKTDTNDAAMLADLALTGFYRKVEVKSGRREHVRYLSRAANEAPSAAALTSISIAMLQLHRITAERQGFPFCQPPRLIVTAT